MGYGGFEDQLHCARLLKHINAGLCIRSGGLESGGVGSDGEYWFGSGE